MPWAITPQGVGKPVGARSISEGWELAGGEFPAAEWTPDMVLANDGVSLRSATSEELAGLVVQTVISDRQFFHALALAGHITEAEALDAVGPGTIPAAFAAAVDALPSEQAFNARMLLRGATSFDRSHPVTDLLGLALGWTDEQIDALWVAAAAL